MMMPLPRIPLPRRPRIPIYAYLAVMGPGLITAAANNDAGGITTYSLAGARFGFSMMWVLLVLTLLLAITQEMGARMGVVTGKGLADLIREEFGLRAVVFALVTLLTANLFVTAAEFAGLASGLELFGLSKYITVPLGAALVWFIVSSGSFRRVERLFMVFVLFYFSYIASGLLADPPWGKVLRSLVVPDFNPDPEFFLLAIAITGTTVAPWGQFFIQSYVRDKAVKLSEYKFTRLDVLSGSVFSNTIAFFIMLATAVTLFVANIDIHTAADAARALRPLAGEQAQVLFGTGLVAASTLAACILPLSTAYVVCEAFGWESGVGKGWGEALPFNAIFTGMIALGAAMVLIPNVSLIRLMVFSETVNGILLPVILIYTVRLCGNKRLMGEQANSRWYGSLIWLFAATIIALTVYLLIRRFAG